METQRIVNLLNSSENEYSKLATKKLIRYWQRSKGWLLIPRSNKVFNKVSLCDYSDAYVLVTRDIAVTRTIAVPVASSAGTQPQRKQVLTATTQVAFKNCALFKDCRTNQWYFCWLCKFY